MKCALITEEQIKAIEYALYRLDESSSYGRNIPIVSIQEALAIVKSLKVQEPIGFKQSHGNAISWHESGLFPIPVYAGEKP